VLRPLATAASALLYAAAVPPWDIDLLGPVVLTPFLLALRGARTKTGFVWGAALGLASAATVTWWATPMLARYFDLSFPAAAVVAAGMYLLGVGLPMGAFGAGSAALLRSSRLAAYTGIPALWVAGELARTHLFTGLPWEFLGHTLHRRASVIQIADTTGAYGVSFLCALTALAVADALGGAARTGEGRGRRPGLVPLAIVAALWGATALYGRHRLAAWDAPAETMRVVAVQADRPPVHRWSPAATARMTRAYLELTRSRLDGHRPALIVWPENTAGFYLDQDPLPLQALRRLSADTGATLIVGGPRRDPERNLLHNAAYAVTAAGIAGAYHKIRLVPFAEYDPLDLGRRADATTFVAGERPRPLPHARGPVGVLICYEVLYPHLARALVREGARLLVNISNDAWLDPTGRRAAPQHFSMAVFRAVETRRWLVRAATTGISGVIAPTGIPVAVLPGGRADVLGAEVGLDDTPSPYVRAGDVFAWGSVALALASLALGRRAA
jgi:apolipoprotein N-acyltransferase